MSNEIKLEYPYNLDWRKGYLTTDVDGRSKLVLYNSKKDRSSTLYSRYLMSVHKGRYLTVDEHVDHKDENRFNDSIKNLQILTIKENNTKSSRNRGGKRLVDLTCPYCGTRFTRNYNQSHFVKPKEYDYCSRKCIGKSCSNENIFYEMNPDVYMQYSVV